MLYIEHNHMWYVIIANLYSILDKQLLSSKDRSRVRSLSMILQQSANVSEALSKTAAAHLTISKTAQSVIFVALTMGGLPQQSCWGEYIKAPALPEWLPNFWAAIQIWPPNCSCVHWHRSAHFDIFIVHVGLKASNPGQLMAFCIGSSPLRVLHDV